MTGNPAIARVLEEVAGLDVGALGRGAVEEAVRRHRLAHEEDEDAYTARLASDPEARMRLLEDVLVQETSFFRYPASFDLLVRHLTTRTPAAPRPLRILDVGCATGQEPLSVVMALLEAGVEPPRIEVSTVDISSRAIETASRGRFERFALRGLSPERHDRWFDRDGPVSMAKPDLTSHVRATTGNVLDPAFLAGVERFDAVLCRNVLVYLTPEARRRALAALRRLVRDDGILLVGHAEVLAAREEHFVPIDADGAFGMVPVVSALEPAPRPEPSLRSEPERRPGTEGRETPAPRHPAPRSRRRRATAATPPLPAANDSSALEGARGLADAGRNDEARALVERLLREGAHTADAYCLLAVLERAAGRPREAEAALTRALYLDPAHRESLLLAAVGAEERGDRRTSKRLRARAAADPKE